MMRRPVLLLALCGCASAGSSVENSAARPPAIFTSAETGTLFGETPHGARASIAAPPAAVWLAAKRAYMDFDIPLTVENPATHQMGNANFFKMRQLAGHPMTQFVDCGNGMDGPKAASYRIYISLLTSIVADGKGGTTIQTTFIPSGQDMSGNSTDRIPCGTSGRLEALFLERINAVIGKS